MYDHQYSKTFIAVIKLDFLSMIVYQESALIFVMEDENMFVIGFKIGNGDYLIFIT